MAAWAAEISGISRVPDQLKFWEFLELLISWKTPFISSLPKFLKLFFPLRAFSGWVFLLAAGAELSLPARNADSAQLHLLPDFWEKIKLLCNSWSGRFWVTHPEGRTAQDELKIRTRRSSSRSVTAILEPWILGWRWKTDPGSSQIIPKVRIPLEKSLQWHCPLSEGFEGGLRVWTFFVHLLLSVHSWMGGKGSTLEFLIPLSGNFGSCWILSTYLLRIWDSFPSLSGPFLSTFLGDLPAGPKSPWWIPWILQAGWTPFHDPSGSEFPVPLAFSGSYWSGKSMEERDGSSAILGRSHPCGFVG